MLLGIDIGGTKTRIAAFSPDGGRLARRTDQVYASPEVQSLGAVVADYRRRHPHPIEAIGIGAAGPVVGRRVKLTNLSWEIDADQLAATVSVPVVVVNDLVAHGYGLAHAGPEHRIVLQAGVPRAGNAAVIAAGTGLGEAILAWDGKRHIPLATEGGHADFAPPTAEDEGLLPFIRRKHPGHVSWERVVSGRNGWRNIYDYMCERGELTPSPAYTERLRHAEDIGAVIGEALAAGEAFAAPLVRRFVRLYGAEAGNLALKCLAVGGMYVVGAVACKLLPQLRSEGFVEAFAAKGRFEPLLKQVPVIVVTDPDLAVKGAAAAAWTH
jgi:glucokinase